MNNLIVVFIILIGFILIIFSQISFNYSYKQLTDAVDNFIKYHGIDNAIKMTYEINSTTARKYIEKHYIKKTKLPTWKEIEIEEIL